MLTQLTHFRSLLYTLTHTFKIQIEAQRKQWRKMRGYEIHFGYEFQQQQQKRNKNKMSWGKNEIKWTEKP